MCTGLANNRSRLEHSGRDLTVEGRGGIKGFYTVVITERLSMYEVIVET